MDVLFIKYCGEGKLEELKQHYETIPFENREYVLSFIGNVAFCGACQNGHLEVIRWINEIFPTIKMVTNIHYNFSIASLYGRLDIIRQLYEWTPNMDISANNDEAFMWACWSGNLDIIKQLIEWKPTLDIYCRNKSPIGYLCKGDHVNILKYLIELKGSLDFTDIDLAYVNNPEIRRLILRQNLIMGWLATTKEVSEDLSECPICREEIQQYIETPCRHKYCQPCISDWLERNTSCPYCRKKII